MVFGKPGYIEEFYNENSRLHSINVVLKNEDSVAAAKNLTVEIITDDPRIEEILVSSVQFQDLCHGAVCLIYLLLTIS